MYCILQWLPDWFVAVSHEIQRAGLTGFDALLPFTVIVPALVLSITVHEFGHWVAGHFMGYYCLIYSVLWLRVERHGSKWRARLARTRNNAWGFVVSVPSRFHRFRLRHSIFLSAGPLLNLLTGGVALLVSEKMKLIYLLSQGVSLPVFMLGLLLGSFGCISVCLGVMNLLPLTLTTDGAKILQLLLRTPAAARSYALLRIHDATYQGQRPRDWNPAWLPKLLGSTTNTEADCLAHLYAYSYYFDVHDLTQGRFHLNAALDCKHIASAPVQQLLFCQAAYVAGVHNAVAADAQHWLTRAEQIQPLPPEDSYFVRAAVAFSLHHDEQALHLLALAEAKAALMTEAGSREYTQDCIADIRRRIAERHTASAAEPAYPAVSQSASPEAEPHLTAHSR
ncbi:M50 family metallopeptidase [Hymenobacter puniceus]|uniref:M50 family metallopeptidase n=1 Tax=Hymenobacter sp. BT190 TaxID=2763505 RepID=UPI00165118A5|nr:M50 family metallopeptidase [Hymenobacter sp. BT190]MBC6697169.1 M50 family metallopeptidase [Hymenobacter sp. BT190]